MKHRPRWQLVFSVALFFCAVALGALVRRQAQASSCQVFMAGVQLESVSVDGAPGSTEPYAGYQVLLFGEPAAVRLTASNPQMQGFYKETYLAQSGARR